MPSNARLQFQEAGSEIRDFFAIHQLTKDVPVVRQNLDVLNKGMIVLLSALWGGFCEDLAAEALLVLVDEAPDANALPTALRRTIARELEQSPQDLAVWALAGSGWRNVLRTRLNDLQEERNRRLNTPKSANIDEFFKRALGIDKMSSKWATPRVSTEENASKLDGFIDLRNEIAHRGGRDTAVTKTLVKNFNNHVQRLSKLTESAVGELVEPSIGRSPWDEK